MKNNFIKILLTLIIITCSACTNNNLIGISTPWSDCQDNLNKAAEIAGFQFPMLLSNYTVRAMKDMIEITYPLDETRYVTVRKSQSEVNNGDNSGDYTKYVQNTILALPNGVDINIRGNNDKIYVMYFGAESGYYSARCEQGMTKEEVEGIFKVIEQVEAQKLPPEA